MAEEKKSIEISYKANLSDLLAKLKTIPNVTDAEAKKMVAALDRQLKQAEKAAKKSAEASKKAAKEASMAARRSVSDFDDMADAARRAEDRMEKVGESAGDIDRGFSSVGLALRGVNPQLAEAADGIADAFAVTEGLTMSMTALNPVVLGIAAALGTLTLGYMAYQQEVEKARQLTLDMKEAQRALNDSYKELRANFDDSLEKLGAIQDEYAVLTGEITEYELALRNTERQTKAMFQSNIDQQQTMIDQRTEELAMVNRIIEGNRKSVADQAILSETEKDRLHNLQLITDGVNKSVDLTKHDLSLNNELFKIRNALQNEIATQEKAMGIIVGHQEQAVQLALEIQEYENENKKAKESQVKSTEKKVEKMEEEKDLLGELMEAENAYFDRQNAARMQLDELNNEIMLSEEERKALAFEKELERIAELGEISGKQAEADMLVQEKINQVREEGMKKAMELQKELMDKTLEHGDILFSGLGEFASAAMALAKENGRESSKAMRVLFRMSQIAAVGEIGMTAAKEYMKALALPKGLRGIRIGTITAAAAANAGLVMAQQPPQSSFHMGGMAPDEMGARVLTGEAVLDRATVDRIGGEQGVQQLQNGGMMQDRVVVIQPFKHFGRFVREIGYKPQKQTGIRAY
jgi:hypothetical protein